MTSSAVTLSTIAELQVGFAFKSSQYTKNPNDRRLLRGDNIAQGVTRWDNVAYWQSEWTEERYELRAGDVVLAMDRPWIGAGLKYASIWPVDLPALLVQRVARLRAKPGTVPRYLHYVIGSRDFTEHILAVQTGTAIPHVSGEQILSYGLTPHSSHEQRAIAEVLGALDDKIAANERLAETAHALAGHLYDQTVALLPMRPMSQVLDPILGGTPSRAVGQYWDGELAWASVRDITSADHGALVDTAERITSIAVAETKAKPLPMGSVLLSARGTVGEVARIAVAMSFNQSCYGFAPGRLPAGVLYFAVLRATQRVKAIAHGSVFDTITRKTFDQLVVPSPGGELLQSLERHLGPLLAAIDQRALESRQLASTRDALLSLLMSGKVRVKDAERAVEEVV